MIYAASVLFFCLFFAGVALLLKQISIMGATQSAAESFCAIQNGQQLGAITELNPNIRDSFLN